MGGEGKFLTPITNAPRNPEFMSRLSLILTCLFLGIQLNLALADGPAGPPPKKRTVTPVEPESVPESVPTADYGQVLFFANTESRPTDERFKVKVGDEVPVCVKLSPNASAYVDKLRDRAIGFLLVMEDSAEPPHRLSIPFGNRLKRLKAGPDGCMGGTWKVPTNTFPGVYQVSDLFWTQIDQSFYSLRNYLYEFSKVEELEVINPKADAEAPKLLGIETFKKSPIPMEYYSGVLRVRVEQIFEIEDKESGLNKKTLRVFYRVDVDGTTVDLLNAKCGSVAQTNRKFRCVLKATNPEIMWGLNQVKLTLQSVSIEDQAGNRLLLEGEDAIKALLPKAETSFLYERKKRLRDEPLFDLKKDPNVPPARDF